MYKQVSARIEEELGHQAVMQVEAEVSESTHKVTEAHITVRMRLGEKELAFPTDRNHLESLYQSLGELLEEIPYPPNAPFLAHP